MPKTVGLVFALLCTAFSSSMAATFTVSSAADAGAGTLRQAIISANANPGADTIVFSVPGSGVHVISPLSLLPTITDTVAIDGTTQPGYSGNPLIRLDGGAMPTALDGLVLSTTGCVVRALNLTRFGKAINMVGGGDHLLTDNFIGTDPSGTSILANQVGVYVQSSSNNRIGGDSAHSGNLISGNLDRGIVLAASNNVVQGNFVGTDITGTTALANRFGILIQGSSNWIGGVMESALNVISGNLFDGVEISGVGVAGNRIANNFIGVDSGGGTALGNGAMGIRITGNGNRVGGLTKYERNVISANQFGVHIFGSDNHVEGNFIGTDEEGSEPLGNVMAGVEIGGKGIPVTGNIIGGKVPEARNVISGNGIGVSFSGETVQVNEVLGNRIGTDRLGERSIANRIGVQVAGGAHGNYVGGGLSDWGNLISGNLQYNLFIYGPTTTNNLVLGNKIGTDAKGLYAVTNGTTYGIGVAVSNAPANRIGGPGATNLISGNESYGIYIVGPSASNNIVQCNLVGTDATGLGALGNRLGMAIWYCTGNQIGGSGGGEGNVVAASYQHGISLHGGGHVAMGNFVGTDVTGKNPLGNGEGIVTGADGMIVVGSNMVIGGSSPYARNILSGNRNYGLQLHEASYCRVEGNYIGTDVDGMAPLGNGWAGIILNDACHNNTIGGTGTNTGNVICANGNGGIIIWQPDTTANTVLGNKIGLDASGVGVLGNAVAGVWIKRGAFNNQIGDFGSTNYIAGNKGPGVFLEDTDTRLNAVRANWIGINRAGAPAGNEGPGIYMHASTTYNSIGLNRIAFNAGDGVLVEGYATQRNSIGGDSIFQNGGLGINLRPDGEGEYTVTANDDLDFDTGPNNQQNFPVLTNITYSSNIATIQGYLSGSPAQSYAIHFYANRVSDPSGHGEGERLIGLLSISTGASGTANFTVSYLEHLESEYITATATDMLTRDTSEFSQAAGGMLILGVKYSKDGAVVRFTSSNGAKFRLEATDSLKAPIAWKSVAGADELKGTGDVMTFVDTGGIAGGRYYRLVKLGE